MIFSGNILNKPLVIDYFFFNLVFTESAESNVAECMVAQIMAIRCNLFCQIRIFFHPRPQQKKPLLTNVLSKYSKLEGWFLGKTDHLGRSSNVRAIKYWSGGVYFLLDIFLLWF